MLTIILLIIAVPFILGFIIGIPYTIDYLATHWKDD